MFTKRRTLILLYDMIIIHKNIIMKTHNNNNNNWRHKKGKRNALRATSPEVSMISVVMCVSIKHLSKKYQVTFISLNYILFVRINCIKVNILYKNIK